jgi:hypothetical protein
MSKLILSAASTAGLALALGVLSAAPAAAQRSTPGEVVVYGTDPCPRTADDDVVVCKRRPEAERYRLPDALRPGGARQERQSWSKQAEALSNIGSTGLNPCSPVGPMGVAGCSRQEINRAFRALREEQASTTPPPE